MNSDSFKGRIILSPDLKLNSSRRQALKLAGSKIYRISILIVLVSFTQVSLISNSAYAAIAHSRTILPRVGESDTRGIDEKKIRTMLENKILAKRLKSHGMSDEEIFSKIEAMSDEQVHQLASLSDRIPAGGDAATAALIVLVVIAAAIILTLALVALSKKG